MTDEQALQAGRTCGASSLLSVADDSLLVRIGAMCRLRNFTAGEVIVEEGKEAAIVGTVVSGVLKMVKAMADGRQQIVGLLMPSDMFGRVYADNAEISIETATDAVLCTFDRKAFEALMQEFPELEHKVLISVLNELDAAREWMLLLGCQSVQERIATFLLMLLRRGALHKPGSGGRRVTVPVKRKDMAAFLGTTAETISRSVQAMAKRGILKIITPQTFEIVSHDDLVAMSGREEFMSSAGPEPLPRMQASAAAR
jgi:CRP/FNR family transcriptional regulator